MHNWTLCWYFLVEFRGNFFFFCKGKNGGQNGMDIRKREWEIFNELEYGKRIDRKRKRIDGQIWRQRQELTLWKATPLFNLDLSWSIYNISFFRNISEYSATWLSPRFLGQHKIPFAEIFRACNDQRDAVNWWLSILSMKLKKIKMWNLF